MPHADRLAGLGDRPGVIGADLPTRKWWRLGRERAVITVRGGLFESISGAQDSRFLKRLAYQLDCHWQSAGAKAGAHRHRRIAGNVKTAS